MAESGSSRVAGMMYAARGVTSRGVSIAATFAMTWIISRSLPVDLAGKFFVAYAVLLGIANVCRFGVDSLAVKLAAADRTLYRPQARASYLLVCLFSAVGALATFGFLLFYLRGIAWWTLLLVGSTVVPLNLALVSGSLLRGLGRITSGSIAELGSLPALVFAQIATIRVLHLHLHLGVLCLMFAAAVYLTCAWSLPLTFATLRVGDAPQHWNVGELWQHSHTSLRQFTITGLGYYLFANVPVMILGSASTQAALFTGSRTLANLVGTVPTIQISYLSPRFAHLFHTGDRAGLNRLVRRSTITGTIVAGLLALPLLAFPRPILHIYKAAYADGSLTLQILAAAMILQVMLGPVQGLLVTCGFERQAARITLIMLGLGTLAMLLVVRGGAPAVALANGLANLGFVIAGAVLLYRSQRIVSPLGIPLPDAARA